MLDSKLILRERTLYVLRILLSSESNGSSGGSSHEEHATKNEFGTVTEDGEYKTCTDRENS